jgi:hypothetical protein
MGFFPTDVAAQLAPRLAIAPQEFDDGVEIEGEEIGRLGMLSATVNVALSFETAAGDPDDVVNVTVTVEQSPDAVDWDDYLESVQTIAVDDNDGEWSALVVIPVNLKGADSHVRVLVQVDHVGAGGFAADSTFLSAELVTGGLVEKPDAVHADGGYVMAVGP